MFQLAFYLIAFATFVFFQKRGSFRTDYAISERHQLRFDVHVLSKD